MKIYNCYKQLIPFLFCILLYNFSFSQDLREYIFPKGILKSTFKYMDKNGKVTSSLGEKRFEYMVAENGATLFEVNKSEDDIVLSKCKREYLISETGIFYVNFNTVNILSYRPENFLGYDNCYLKMPPQNGSIRWSYKESADASRICEATIVKLKIGGVEYPAIKVEKTPFEKGKYYPDFKSYEYYVKGKGFYKCVFANENKTVFTLTSTTFDVKKRDEVESTTTPILHENPEEVIFTKVEQDAEFIGGSSRLIQYLQKNLNTNIPVDNAAPVGTYTVIVKFVVSKDGYSNDIQCENDPGFGMCDEAKRVIKNVSFWRPAMQNGRNVSAYCHQSITFVVGKKPKR